MFNLSYQLQCKIEIREPETVIPESINNYLYEIYYSVKIVIFIKTFLSFLDHLWSLIIFPWLLLGMGYWGYIDSIVTSPHLSLYFISWSFFHFYQVCLHLLFFFLAKHVSTYVEWDIGLSFCHLFFGGWYLLFCMRFVLGVVVILWFISKLLSLFRPISLPTKIQVNDN